MQVLAVQPHYGWTSYSHTSRTVSTTPKGLSTVKRDVGEWHPFDRKFTRQSELHNYQVTGVANTTINIIITIKIKMCKTLNMYGFAKMNELFSLW